ncbi:MAG: MBL fold metallo-hydrolase [Actinomycetota bacterium]|nr:MBL fold metallo-hydrolase [Actinomycetota bacterium]
MLDCSPEAAFLHELAPGVLAWCQPDGSWWINNAGAITDEDGTIIIDTCATEARTSRFLTMIRDATGDAPVRLAVNTHQHGDHTYGNSVLPESTVLIAHEATREGLLVDPLIDGCPPFWEPVPQWGRVTRRVPSVVFRDELTLFAGQRRVELRHPGGAAHTQGDLVVWLPDERVLFSGDLLFHGVTPLVLMGSLQGALRSLDWMAEFEPKHIVPGHGSVISIEGFPDVLAAHERYYRFVLDAARAGKRQGLTPLQAAERCELGEFTDWPDPERLVLNLHREYADDVGGDIDLMTALADAVAFNGGPLRCAV